MTPTEDLPAPAGAPAGGPLTHLDADGHARMVDVGEKAVTERTAQARAVVRISPDTAALLAGGGLPKGDAIAVTRVAAIQAAKRTPELVPLCHVVALTSVAVDVDVDTRAGAAVVTVTATARDRTGVEMEALVGASVGALTLYDMVKGVERGAVIERVELVEKTGGRSGTWRRDA